MSQTLSCRPSQKVRRGLARSLGPGRLGPLVLLVRFHGLQSANADGGSSIVFYLKPPLGEGLYSSQSDGIRARPKSASAFSTVQLPLVSTFFDGKLGATVLSKSPESVGRVDNTSRTFCWKASGVLRNVIALSTPVAPWGLTSQNPLSRASRLPLIEEELSLTYGRLLPTPMKSC